MSAVGFVAVMMFGCKGLLNPFASEDHVVAQVGDAELLESDMKGVCAGVTGEDSVELAEAYVDTWVKKQLKIQAAEEMFSESSADIDRMVQDYRNTLLNNKFDQYYLEQYLDTVFTEKNIVDYYNSRINDFLLDRDIVKGRIVVVPDSYRQLNKLKELMGSDNDEKQQDFMDICVKNDFHITEFTSWTDLNEFMSHLPSSKRDNLDDILSKRTVQQTSYDTDFYLFQISQVKRKGDLNPIERVRESIKRMLYNQRKTEMLKQFEDSLYRKAEEQDLLKINIKHDK